MENNICLGIDEEKDAVVEAPAQTEAGATKMPFCTWTVSGVDYRLKLSTSAICQLEKKYGRNILLIVTDDGIPPISTMLTILQAALAQYNHGITFPAVQEMYDAYVDGGGDQVKLLSEVIMPTLGVSGFFTQKQMDIMNAEMENLDSAL